MMKRLWLVMAFVLGAGLCGVVLPPALAQDDPASEIALPGLQSDADAFVAQLKQAFPAGATDDQKSQASDAAQASLQSGNMAQALPALETLVGAQGDDAGPGRDGRHPAAPGPRPASRLDGLHQDRPEQPDRGA
jgi:hypothetical protein